MIEFDCGLKLTHLNTIDSEYHTLIALSIEHESEKFKVYVVQFKNWKHAELVPNDTESLITFCEEVKMLSRGTDPTTVMCQ